MVDGFVITGGKPLNGVIEVSGAKKCSIADNYSNTN